jgi:signal transduction histidine kinase/PAS domain-containing protein
MVSQLLAIRVGRRCCPACACFRGCSELPPFVAGVTSDESLPGAVWLDDPSVRPPSAFSMRPHQERVYRGIQLIACGEFPDTDALVASVPRFVRCHLTAPALAFNLAVGESGRVGSVHTPIAVRSIAEAARAAIILAGLLAVDFCQQRHVITRSRGLHMTDASRIAMQTISSGSGPLFAGTPSAAGFFQAVIDTFHDPILVVGPDYQLVLANRAARQLAGIPEPPFGCLKCYQVSHGRDQPCDSDEEVCPMRTATKLKGPVTARHVHLAADGREVFTEVTATPLLDETGEVSLIVQTCRDITDRKHADRFLRITNRHVELEPMLAEFVAELRGFTHCPVVGLSLVDESGAISPCRLCCFNEAATQVQGPLCDNVATCLCLRLLQEPARTKLPCSTQGGSIYLNPPKYSLENATDPDVQELRDACACGDFEYLALVPIKLADRILGVIQLAGSGSTGISLALVETLERIALELGTAIQRVRVEEALRAARDKLETRVQQRTAELLDTNRTLRKEIAERTRLEREIVGVTAAEQQRIGQELHDGPGQELTGLSYLAMNLHHKLREQGGAALETAAELAAGIPRVLGQLRPIVRGLVPLEIDARDLQPAIKALLQATEDQSGIAWRFEADARALVADSETAVQIYRIIQEAVANVVKHSQASELVIQMKARDNLLQVAVYDDGIGIPSDVEETSGCGLRVMKYRARAAGGGLDVQARSGGGTVVFCTFPQDSSNDCAQDGGTHQT